jgi:hypothetical protein
VQKNGINIACFIIDTIFSLTKESKVLKSCLSIWRKLLNKHTYHRAHILTLSRYWMAIPVIFEIITVLLNIFKKKCIQRPKMLWVISVKEMRLFEASKKSSSALCKVLATFKPQPLNSSIMCRPVSNRMMKWIR